MADRSLLERTGDAWNAFWGLKRAVGQSQAQAAPQRIGSPPPEDKPAFFNTLSKGYEYFRHWTHLEPDRNSLYDDMDEMFSHVLAAGALDAYCEDATQPDARTETALWAESPNPRVEAELTRLFEILNVTDRIYGDLWSLAKYGDLFGLLMYTKQRGVFDVLPLEPRIVHRHESSQRVLEGFSLGEQRSDDPQYKPWDVVHWRLRSRNPTDPYGTPFFINVRLIYKVLKLMEEQMVIYRMNMHPDRLLFKVFTGNASPDERFRIIRRWRQAMERVVSLNRQSERFISEYAPWQVDQNIFWPIGQNDNQSGVEKFAGSGNAGDIFDINYVRDLFFAGVRVPKGYLGFEDSQGYRYGDTLSQQSIKFARGVKFLRRHLMAGYARVGRIHLALRGINPDLPENEFELQMSPVSYLDEVHKAELFAKRFETVRYMMEIAETLQRADVHVNSRAWASYVLYEYAGMEPALISRLMSPEQEGKADLVFGPQGAKMIFENGNGRREVEHLDAGEIRAIKQALSDRPRLREALEEVYPRRSGYSSQRGQDPDDRAWRREGTLTTLTENTFEGTSSELIEDALQTSSEMQIKIQEEREARRVKELEAIAKRAKAEGEAMTAGLAGVGL